MFYTDWNLKLSTPLSVYATFDILNLGFSIRAVENGKIIADALDMFIIDL